MATRTSLLVRPLVTALLALVAAMAVSKMKAVVVALAVVLGASLAVASLAFALTSSEPATTDTGTSGAATYYTSVATWGSYGAADGQFDDPFGVATDADGNVYVVDRYNNRIQKFVEVPLADKQACKKGGYGALGFKNEGQCIKAVNANIR